MRNCKPLMLVFAVAVAMFLSMPGLALADQERITRFDSAITVHADGTMRVEDAITVVATGDQIRHGIYYDFPTVYSNLKTGGRLVINFQVLGAQRDGQQEPYTVESRANGKRVKIGSADTLIEPGEHTYVLRFTVDRELGYFSDHDELYWNVTGNGWVFPIERASATVTLPAGAAAGITGLQGYTGAYGSSRKGYTVSQASDGTPTFETDTALNPGEGLTIAVGWPKGFVQAPTAATRFGWFLRDNSALIAGIVGIIAVLVYYMVVWSRFGKDPERGTIFAQFAPPEGVSPGGARYLTKMGYDNKTFTAALIDMAVKRYISIHQEGRKYWVERDTAPESVLSDDELAIAGTLLGTRSRMDFEQDNAEDIQEAIHTNRRPLEADYQPIFFVSNTGYFVVGILLSAGVLVLTVFLAIAGTAVQFVAPIVVLVALGIMGVIFGLALKSYTREGRRLADAVEGFRMFLAVTEKDRMNLLNPPDRTPEMFEKYLPFALALDVEQRWSEQFASVFARMEAEGRPYAPAWYYGSYWNPVNPAVFASSIGNSFSNTISASAIAPGQNSGLGGGGGGGFSGGGGGGGGGGGW